MLTDPPDALRHRCLPGCVVPLVGEDGVTRMARVCAEGRCCAVTALGRPGTVPEDAR